MDEISYNLGYYGKHFGQQFVKGVRHEPTFLWSEAINYFLEKQVGLQKSLEISCGLLDPFLLINNLPCFFHRNF